MQVRKIQDKIFEVRGFRIVFDYDLAEMCDVQTRVLNHAVKRNIKRFPKDFMYRLTEKEWRDMSSQFVMTSLNKRPKAARPFVFTDNTDKK
jgi:hypothetical protein